MKNPDQLTLALKPVHGGTYTKLSLSGSLCGAPPPRTLPRLLSMLSQWSGYPVSVVLSVDATTAGWCEVWSAALAAVPTNRLEVRFIIPEARG